MKKCKIYGRATSWRAVIVNGTFREVYDAHRQRLSDEGFTVTVPGPAELQDRERLYELIRDVEVIFGPGIVFNEALFARAEKLQVLSIAASGYEAVDVEAATRRGVVVTNAPTPLGSSAVAELAVGLLFAVVREIPQSHTRIVTSGIEKRSISMQPRPMGPLLQGKTLGIIGLGAIGREVVLLARGIGMRVVACDPAWDERFAEQARIERCDFTQLLKESDFVSLHVRETPETRGMIGAAELALMKPSAYLINTARAALIDHAALAGALTSGALAGAALDTAVDIPNNPLIDLPNVVSTPHLGNRCIEAVQDVMAAAIDNAAAVLDGRRPAYLVNPEVWDNRRAAAYITR